MNLNGKPTNPGELRTQIGLYKRTVTDDAGGFQQVTKTKLADVWCKWQNVHGSEVWAAESLNAVQPATVWLRYRSDIDPTCLVYKGSLWYEIVSIDNVGDRDEYMELKVQRVTEG